MTSATAVPPVAPSGPGPWIVELNIPGCRILRWAQRRRHLLFRPPGMPSEPSLLPRRR